MKSDRKRILPQSADAFLDAALSNMGVDPKALREFLSSHKKASRITAHSLTLLRIVLGEITIRQYEKAYKKKDTQKMTMSALVIACLLATDFIDGYIARKGNIEKEKTGRVLDSAADVYLKVRIVSSVIANSPDALDKIRLMGEGLVGSSAIPDMFKGRYKSSAFGKYKTWTDGTTAITKITRQIIDSSKKEEPKTLKSSLKLLETTAKIAGVGLALTDGVKRAVKKMKS